MKDFTERIQFFQSGNILLSVKQCLVKKSYKKVKGEPKSTFYSSGIEN